MNPSDRLQKLLFTTYQLLSVEKYNLYSIIKKECPSSFEDPNQLMLWGTAELPQEYRNTFILYDMYLKTKETYIFKHYIQSSVLSELLSITIENIDNSETKVYHLEDYGIKWLTFENTQEIRQFLGLK